MKLSWKKTLFFLFFASKSDNLTGEMKGNCFG